MKLTADLKKILDKYVPGYSKNIPGDAGGSTIVAGLISKIKYIYDLRRFVRDFNIGTLPMASMDSQAMREIERTHSRLEESLHGFVLTAKEVTDLCTGLAKTTNMIDYRRIGKLLVDYNETKLLSTIFLSEPRASVRAALSNYIEELQSSMAEITTKTHVSPALITIRLPRISAEYMSPKQVLSLLTPNVAKLAKQYLDGFTDEGKPVSTAAFTSVPVSDKNTKIGIVIVRQITPHPSSINYHKIFEGSESKFHSASLDSVAKYNIVESTQASTAPEQSRVVIGANTCNEFLIAVTRDGSLWYFADPNGRVKSVVDFVVKNPPKAITHGNDHIVDKFEAYAALTIKTLVSRGESAESSGMQPNVVRVIDEIKIKSEEFFRREHPGSEMTKFQFNEIVHNKELANIYVKACIASSKMVAAERIKEIAEIVLSQANQSAVRWMRDLHDASLKAAPTVESFRGIVDSTLRINIPINDAPAFAGLRFLDA